MLCRLSCLYVTRKYRSGMFCRRQGARYTVRRTRVRLIHASSDTMTQRKYGHRYKMAVLLFSSLRRHKRKRYSKTEARTALQMDKEELIYSSSYVKTHGPRSRSAERPFCRKRRRWWNQNQNQNRFHCHQNPRVLGRTQRNLQQIMV